MAPAPSPRATLSSSFSAKPLCSRLRCCARTRATQKAQAKVILTGLSRNGSRRASVGFRLCENGGAHRLLVVSHAGVVEGDGGVEEDVDDELMQKYNTQALIQATRRIKQYGKERQPNLAIRTLADLADQGIQPDMIAATAVIDACINSNKIELAESVFNELFGKGHLIEPDEVTYAVLIKGYGQDRAHPKWIKIKQILQAMEVAGLALTTCTYNTLLEICAASNDWQRGMQVLDQMAELQVSPDQMTLEIVKKRKILRAHLKKLF